MTALSVNHQGGRDKYATGENKRYKKNISGKDTIIIATMIVRTLSQVCKLKELTHEIEQYT